MDDIFRLIRNAASEGLQWDFYEDHDDVRNTCKKTIPGRVVQHFRSTCDDGRLSHRTIGLLTTYVSRRSLPCWFLYCDDERPPHASNGLLHWWLYSNCDIDRFDELWTVEVNPRDKDGAIIMDCRSQDTRAANSAVANAAQFARTNDDLHAITSLSHAFCAFNVSPIGSLDNFEQWFVDFAVPCSLQGRPMSFDEEFALTDYDIPQALRKSETN